MGEQEGGKEKIKYERKGRRENKKEKRMNGKGREEREVRRRVGEE